MNPALSNDEILEQLKTLESKREIGPRIVKGPCL